MTAVAEAVTFDLRTAEGVQGFLRRYKRSVAGAEGPVKFVQEVLRAEPEVWQADLLRAYGRGERRLSVRSGHGVGKTAVLAWIVVHHALTELPQKTAMTAPTSHQMFDALWPEIGKWFRRCPSALTEVFTFKSDRIEHQAMPKEHFISAATARPESPEALAGIHCEDGSVLLIADEASGIHEAIFESASGSMSGHTATTILAGNPVRTSGLFFDTHHKLADQWVTAVVSCADSQRVSPDYLADMARRYGPGSNQYRVRVLGEFPTSDADTIIPYELLAAAQVRDVAVNPQAPWVWGVDVARYGNDRTVLVKRQANRVVEYPKVWRDKDVMQVAALIHEEWVACRSDDRPAEILVDSIGLGAGVADRLRQLDLPARDVNVAESAALRAQYANLKAELWYAAKEWFQRLDCSIPADVPLTEHGELAAELGLARFHFTRLGKLQVESKEEIKKRGHDSPDLADAFVLTFAGAAAQLGYGGQRLSWNTPLRREVNGLA